jgi:hypothetical protein
MSQLHMCLEGKVVEIRDTIEWELEVCGATTSCLIVGWVPQS